MNEIENILSAISNNQDDPGWLSEACVLLAGSLYRHNALMAEAELKEKQETIRHMDSGIPKKLSVAESEKRAVVATNNEYGKLKTQGEAIKEVINSIKIRIKVLEIERGLTPIN